MHTTYNGNRLECRLTYAYCAEAARELMRAIEDGWMIATACDGPTGPIFHPKAGPLEIARRHHIALLPMGFGALHRWDITPAWDHFRLPWPGTRVAVAYGEPILYPSAEPTPAELEARIADVTGRLWALEAEAMAVVRGALPHVPAGVASPPDPPLGTSH